MFDVSRVVRTWRAGRSSLRTQATSVFSLAVAFVCLAAALLVVTNLAVVQERWSRAGRATVYLKDGATEEDVASIVAALEKTPSVQKVRYVSATEARREVLADQRDASLATLPPNAFPASLEVGFDAGIEDDALAGIALKLQALPLVDTVETYEKWTEKLSALLQGGVTASLCLALVVLAAVISVVGSTMRMLLQQRRIEVEVLRLVGATNDFVRRPFVVEGAAQGASGALVAILILGALFAVVRGRLDGSLASLLGVEPSFLPWYVALGMVALGGLLGAMTALVSLRKLLAV